jgi:hypothetical protein
MKRTDNTAQVSRMFFHETREAFLMPQRKYLKRQFKLMREVQ